MPYCVKEGFSGLVFKMDLGVNEEFVVEWLKKAKLIETESDILALKV